MTILGFHKSEGYSLFRGQLFYRKSSDKTSPSAVIPAFPIKFESLLIFRRAISLTERRQPKMPTVKNLHSNFVIFTSESKQKCIRNRNLGLTSRTLY